MTTNSDENNKSIGGGGLATTLVNHEGLLTFNQGPVVTEDATLGDDVGAKAIISKHIGELPWTLARLVEKKNFINQFPWNTSDTTETILYSLDIGGATFQQIGSFDAAFSQMSYWRGDVIVEIKCNGTKFHCGRLQAFFVPMAVDVPGSQLMDNLSFRTAMPNIFIDASTTTTQELRIPFRQFQTYLPTYTTRRFSSLQAARRTLGRLVVAPFQVLRATDGASVPLYFSISIRMENAEFFVPSLTPSFSLLSRRRFLVGTEEDDRAIDNRIKELEDLKMRAQIKRQGTPNAAAEPIPKTTTELMRLVPVVEANGSRVKPYDEDMPDNWRTLRDIMKRANHLGMVQIGPLGRVPQSKTNTPIFKKISVNRLLGRFDAPGGSSYSRSQCLSYFRAPFLMWRGTLKIKAFFQFPLPLDVSKTQVRPFICFLNGDPFISDAAVANDPDRYLVALITNQLNWYANSDGSSPYQTEIGTTMTMVKGNSNTCAVSYGDQNTSYLTLEIPMSTIDNFLYRSNDTNDSLDVNMGCICVGIQPSEVADTPLAEIGMPSVQLEVSVGDSFRMSVMNIVPSVIIAYGTAGATNFNIGPDTYPNPPAREGTPNMLAAVGAGLAASALPNIVKRLLPKMGGDGLDKKNEMDKPSNTVEGVAVLRQAAPFLAQSDNIESTQVLAFNPSYLPITDADITGSAADENDLFMWMRKLTVMDRFTWSMSDAPDTALWNLPICPNAWLGMNGKRGTRYAISLFDYFASQASFWTGTIRYRFQIAATGFHSGRLFIATTYGEHLTPSDIGSLSLQQVTSQYGVFIDLGDGVTDFTFDVPYRATTPRKAMCCGPLSNSMYSYGANCSIGLISVWVVNALVAPSGAPATIDVAVYNAAGEDLQLGGLGLCNTSLLPVVSN